MRRQRRIILYIIFIIGLFCVYIGYLHLKNTKLVLKLHDAENVCAYYDIDNKKVTLWENDEQSYIFLPSYVTTQEVTLEAQLGYRIFVDEQAIKQKKMQFEYNRPYHIQVKGKGEDLTIALDKKIVFMKSDNIPAMYISLEEELLDEINDNKEIKTPADIEVMTADGEEQYRGKLEYLSGRGNTTWNEKKKPYTIKLKEKASLCGLEQGKNFVLLANVMEGTKLQNKVTFDIASFLDMPATPDATWVDLYLNGEYYGNYLLCEQVRVGDNSVDIHNLKKDNETYNGTQEYQHIELADKKGYILDHQPSDITGGYLIEKDYLKYYQESACGFLTKEGYAFSMKSPSNASIEEVTYMQKLVQNIEDAMKEGREDKFEILDMDSLAKTYIINEITLNDDSGETSMYFYKEKGKDTLYSGPVWDYDRSYGRTNTYQGFKDSILNMKAKRGSMSNVSGLNSSDKLGIEEVLLWYRLAYKDEAYQQHVKEVYQSILPDLNRLLESDIDQYASYIGSSMAMDMIRWNIEGEIGGHYLAYDNNVRYLKYFLSNRLQYLNQMWGIDYDVVPFEGNGTIHTVIFQRGDDLTFVEVEDGETVNIEDIPELKAAEDTSWKFMREDADYMIDLPVFEDVVIVEKWEK